MFSLRALIRPSVLGPSLAAAAAICGVVVWRAYATVPVPTAAPSIDVASDAPSTGWSVQGTASEEIPPAAVPWLLRLTEPTTDPDDINWGYRSFVDDARFPAVSGDGTIAALFQDGEDFTDTPITTLVAWSKSGARVASFAIGGHTWDGSEEKVLREANAWLSRSTWTSLGADASSTWNDDHTLQTIAVAGAPITFDVATDSLKRGGRAVRASFGAAGTWDEGGACGSITGVERAFGTKNLVVLVPTMMLGGDSCFGSPSADVATAVALR